MDNLIKYYTLAFKNFKNTSGRASRAEYWWFVLANFLISFVLELLNQKLNYQLNPLVSLYNLVVFLPSLSLSIRRLHDLGKSGWMLLVSLIPIIGWFWILFLMASKGDEGENKYGTVNK